MYITCNGAKLYSGFVFSFLTAGQTELSRVIPGVEYYEYQA